MRRRFGQFLDKALDHPRSTSPSGSRSPAEGQDVKGRSSTPISTSLPNHQLLKETSQTVQHEGLKLSISALIEYLEDIDGSIDNAIISKLDNEIKQLSQSVSQLHNNLSSASFSKASDDLAEGINAAVKKARSPRPKASRWNSFVKPDYAQDASRLSDDLHTTIEHYRGQSTCDDAPSHPAPKKTVREISGRVVGALSIVKEMLDGVPVPGLKAAVGGLVEVLGALNKLIDNDDDLMKLIDHVQRLIRITTNPIQCNRSGPDISLEKRIEDLTSVIQQVTADAVRIQEQNLSGKFLGRVDNASAITGLSVAIDRAVDRFQISGTLRLEKGIGELQGDVEDGFNRLESEIKSDVGLVGNAVGRIENKLEDMETARVSASQEIALNAIHPRADSARYDSNPQLSSSFCLEDTRVALLNEIEQWAEDPSSPPIFWLCGMAGTGKSTIARTVAKRFDDSHCLGASFFFSRDEHDRRTTHLVFPTIAYQLARRIPSVREHIIGAATLDVCTAMLRTQINKLFAEPLQLATIQNSPLVIVMDALDECEKEAQITEMLVLLAPAIRAIQSSINIKIFLTSRPEVHISTEFKEPGMQAVSNVSILHDIEQSLLRTDISRYIEYHLQRIAKLILPQDVVWPKSQDKEALVDMAAGLFIFAAVTMAYIGDTKYRKPKQRLRSILLTSDQNKAPIALKHLDVLYQQILMASLPEGDEDEEFQDMMHQLCEILGTIVLLLYPLSSRSLEKLLQWEEDTVEPALGPFHSVLSISPNPTPIRVFHKSFPDFLLDKRRSGGSWFHIDSSEHHGRLALLCLTHINTSLRRDMCGVGNRLMEELDDVEAILQMKVEEHVLYACRYWASHLKRTKRTNELMAALKYFYEHQFLYWLEILCLDGKLSWGILALDSARKWSLGDTISKGLDDCYRYLSYHQNTISIGPSHIYQSALPFVPRSILLALPWEQELYMSPRVVMADSYDGWDRMLFTLTTNSKEVNTVAYSRDGALLAGGCHHGTVIVWDSRTGAQIHSLEGHRSRVESIGFSPDGDLIASGSRDRSVIIWSSETGILIHKLRTKSHPVGVQDILFSPLGNIVASTFYDGKVILWDVKTGSVLRAFEGDSDAWITAITFSPDGTQIVSGSEDNTIMIWSTESGTVIERLVGHLPDSYIGFLAFSPDGTLLASRTKDKVILWDYQSRAVIRMLDTGAQRDTDCSAFSPDWRFFVTGTDLGEIVIWDMTDGTQICIFSGHSRTLNSVAVSPDGSRIVTCGLDGTAVVWDMGSSWASYSCGNDNSSKKVHTSPVTCVAFSLDGTRVASGAGDIVALWDITSRTLIRTLKCHQTSVGLVAFSTDGRYVAAGAQGRCIIVWDVESGESIKTLDFNGPILGLGFSLDGLHLVVHYFDKGGHEDGSLRYRQLEKWSTHDFEQCQPPSLTEEEAREVLSGSTATGTPPSGTYLARDQDSQWVEKRCQGTTVERLCHLSHRDIKASASFGRYFVFGTYHGGIYLLDFPPETFGITSTTMYSDDDMVDHRAVRRMYY
ncbi:hypothetical protein FRC03_002244 [Tulasnella sp. 419]|nr:hypothetical protein FRC03_002244 [Tulasnella sp. 419]